MQRLVHWASRGAIDIEGLGEERVRQFVEAGLLEDAADVYALTVERLVPLERIGERSAQLLVDAIEGSKRQPLWRVLVGLGINHVGPTAAQALARAFDDLDAIMAAGSTSSSPRSTASARRSRRASASWFSIDRNRRLVQRLRAAGRQLRRASAAQQRELVDASFAGLTFVLTGSLEQPHARRGRGRDRARGAAR